MKLVRRVLLLTVAFMVLAATSKGPEDESQSPAAQPQQNGGQAGSNQAGSMQPTSMQPSADDSEENE